MLHSTPMAAATNSNILEPGDFELLPVLWSPWYDKTSRWKAHKASPQNHETISIYTRLPGMVLTPLGKEEKEIDTFQRFPCTWVPMGLRWRTTKGVSPRMGREKHFSPGYTIVLRINTHKSYGKSSSPGLRVYSIMFARMQPYRDDEDPEGWWRLS